MNFKFIILIEIHFLVSHLDHIDRWNLLIKHFNTGFGNNVTTVANIRLNVSNI
jgi:hypothetical protein